MDGVIQADDLKRLLERQIVKVRDAVREEMLTNLSDPILSNREVAIKIRKPGASFDTLERWRDQITGASGRPIA